ncbi:uncharacterized protein IUM83_10071 [Phytophthora cinnamomi]|uniref:uncharacterized protein n=1 Tax=Phytophthora cinnamomi TaxID=4785 RepID=UPI00355A439D|nr:hypothetical protein IUM83_10071 [Phytophthora cinnamomi]
MEALYERVLAHVPTSQLHKNYNTVLHEEFASVSQTLGDALAAFAKLEEVHDAVSKLQQQQSHPPTSGLSDSLKVSIGDAMELQRQLQRRVGKLAVGMEVAQLHVLERKRKRVVKEKEGVKVTTVVGDQARRPGCNGPVKRTKPLQTEADLVSDRLEGGISRRPRISSISNERSASSVVKQEVVAASSSVADSASDEDKIGGSEASRKALASKRGALLSSGSSEEGTKMTATNEDKGVLVVIKREMPAASNPKPSSSSESESDAAENESDEDTDKVGGSEAAWKALTTMVKHNIPSSKLNSLPGSTKNASHQADTSTSLKPLEKSATYMKTIVAEVNLLPPLDRSFIIPEVVTELKASVEEDVDGVQQYEVTSSLETVVDWCHCKYQGQHVRLYREYAFVVKSYLSRLPSATQKPESKRLMESLFSRIESFDRLCMPGKKESAVNVALKVAKKRPAFSIGGHYALPHRKQFKRLLRLLLDFKKLPDQSTRDSIAGLLENMSEAISDPSNSRNREQLGKLHIRATQLLGKMQKFQRNCISSRVALKLKSAVEALMEDATIGWTPYRDTTMRKCVQELTSILVQAKDQASGDIKSRRNFDVFLAVVTKWKVDLIE